MTATLPVTPAVARTLTHYCEHIGKTGKAPSIRKLCEMAGSKSYGTMRQNLETLVQAGYLLPRSDRLAAFEVIAGAELQIIDRTPALAAKRVAALVAAERFISGFEGDELQDGVSLLLAQIRAAIGNAA